MKQVVARRCFEIQIRPRLDPDLVADDLEVRIDDEVSISVSEEEAQVVAVEVISGEQAGTCVRSAAFTHGFSAPLGVGRGGVCLPFNRIKEITGVSGIVVGDRVDCIVIVIVWRVGTGHRDRGSIRRGVGIRLKFRCALVRRRSAFHVRWRSCDQLIAGQEQRVFLGLRICLRPGGSIRVKIRQDVPGPVTLRQTVLGKRRGFYFRFFNLAFGVELFSSLFTKHFFFVRLDITGSQKPRQCRVRGCGAAGKHTFGVDILEFCVLGLRFSFGSVTLTGFGSGFCLGLDGRLHAIDNRLRALEKRLHHATRYSHPQ